MKTNTKSKGVQTRPMPYPAPFQVQAASQLQLARWLWRLEQPATDDQLAVYRQIETRFKGWTPWLRKCVNWTND